MNLLLSLLAQLLRCLVMLCRKDGLSAVTAQNLLLTQQTAHHPQSRAGTRSQYQTAPPHSTRLLCFLSFQAKTQASSPSPPPGNTLTIPRLPEETEIQIAVLAADTREAWT